MFRDAPETYKDNPFLSAISKPGTISQFFYEGTYYQLDSFFHKGWTEKVAAKLNISKGLFLACYLADLLASLKRVQSFKCFDKVKSKLAVVDESFIPTVFEVEMAERILGIFKSSVNDIEFAGCFKTKENKKIDLRAKIQGKWVYFEMTKVMDYRGRADVLKLYNLVSAFLISVETAIHKKLELRLVFPSIPNQETIDFVINQVTKWINDKQFNAKLAIDGVIISLQESKDKAKVTLQIASDRLSNKLKDKYFDELEHFEEGDINVTVIDTTFLPDKPEELYQLTKRIFQTEGDLSIIAAVILACKEHIIENHAFPLKTQIGHLVIFNDKCDKSKTLEQMFKTA